MPPRWVVHLSSDRDWRARTPDYVAVPWPLLRRNNHDLGPPSSSRRRPPLSTAAADRRRTTTVVDPAGTSTTGNFSKTVEILAFLSSRPLSRRCLRDVLPVRLCTYVCMYACVVFGFIHPLFPQTQ